MALSLAAALATFAWSHATQDAIANGDTRTLSLYHTHSKESATITFRRNGQYDSDGLKQLNRFLRDWRNDDETKMDPRLFDVVWAAYRESGSGEPINIVSAYRSPDTNAMLRRRSRAVAENSQHMAGKAMDFFLSDVGMDKVRAIGMRLQQGGVGFYPTSYNPFVHLDVGSVRSWPRMTHDQLARIFPDGKTVHLPTDGKPLARYEEARAEILARGGAVAGVSTYAGDDGNGGRRRSLWASLFGGEEEDSEMARAPAPARTQIAARGAPVAIPTGASEDGGTRGVAALPETRRAPPPAPAPAPPASDANEGSAGPWTKLMAGLSPKDEAGVPGDKSRALAFAPVPPARPAEMPTLVDGLPLPPARPLVLAALDPPSANRDGDAALRQTFLPEQRFVAHAPPPARPGGYGAPTALSPPVYAPAVADEGDPVRVFFIARPAEKAPRRAARMVAARPTPRAIGGDVLASAAPTRLRMAFSQEAGGPDVDRFSGPAVAPLPTCSPAGPNRC